MRDRLQKIADRFCAKFGLKRVTIKFAEGISEEDVRTITFLFCKDFSFERIVEQTGLKRANGYRRLLASIAPIEKKQLAMAKENILWKEFISNSEITTLTVIEKNTAIVLEAAFYIWRTKSRNIDAVRRSFRLNEDQLELAQVVAKKMEMFHAEGKVIKLIKDLVKSLKRNVGKLSLVKESRGGFERYVHEVIHCVLMNNGIYYAGADSFNEGICTYLHFKFRWSRACFSPTYIFGRTAKYRVWSKYFKAKLQVPDRKIGPLLKRNLKLYVTEMRKKYGI